MRSIEIIFGPYGYEQKALKDFDNLSASNRAAFPFMPYEKATLAPELSASLGDDVEYHGGLDVFFVFSVHSLGMEDTFIVLHVAALSGNYLGELVPKVRQLAHHIPSDKLVKKQLDIG